MELSSFFANVLHHSHGFALLLLLRVDLHHHLCELLEGLRDFIASLGTYLHVADAPLLDGFLDVLELDLAVLLEVALVAEEDELDVGDGVLVNLRRGGVTSLSQ